MNVLVVGSKGFIGTHCMTFLSDLGYNTVGCDVVESNEKDYYSLKSIDNNFNWLFQNYKFDCCINAAGSAHVSYSFQYPEKDFEKNVFLVITLLGAIKNYSPACKLINFSSAAVYGNPVVLPIKEDCFAAPLSPYGYHKLLSGQGGLVELDQSEQVGLVGHGHRRHAQRRRALDQGFHVD
ncbi:MAG TPA: NAD-dependent epimerase/dehydratase family protein, partial [Bacteroidia bacterium]|nr:NAD-dependent epimerase/dehydratase family protein [Bacteroidia bacterium]